MKHPAMLSAAVLAAAALSLTGCNQGKKDDGAKAAAGGQLLARSVSDDMLPYDTVTSQPELLDPQAASAADSNGASKRAAQVQADAPEEQDVPDSADNDGAGDGDTVVTSQDAPAAPASTGN